jgi:S-formylglutathione hydrolase FrmB
VFGGEFGHPDDLLRAGVLDSLDDFSARHRGNAPVMVFPDTGGQFSNDTECVNGTRGNSADHLTKDVIPYVISNFGVSSDPANWGLAGWSAGGTCALTLSLLHPELFRSFVDIDGQLGPNAGTLPQTIARLFGSDPAAWAAFDPRSIVIQRGRYSGMSAWFGVSAAAPTVYRDGNETNPDPSQADWDTNSDDHATVANKLCSLLGSHGVMCSVSSFTSSHDYAGAVEIFAKALPWLAGNLGTPGVAAIALPGAPAA